MKSGLGEKVMAGGGTNQITQKTCRDEQARAPQSPPSSVFSDWWSRAPLRRANNVGVARARAGGGLSPRTRHWRATERTRRSRTIEFVLVGGLPFKHTYNLSASYIILVQLNDDCFWFGFGFMLLAFFG